MKNTKGFFICITGIDGSGKSTQAKCLMENCRKNGIPMKYVYAKTVPILFKPFLMISHFLVLRNYDENNKYLEYKSKKQSVIKKHKFLSDLFYNILLFDYQIQLFFKIRVPIFLRQNIVCDRYIFDTIITDIAVDRNDTLIEIIDSINKIGKKYPQPDLLYLIDIPEKIAYKRKTDVVSIDYLKERREAYLAIAGRYNMVIINGMDPINDIESRIFQDVVSRIGGDRCQKL